MHGYAGQTKGFNKVLVNTLGWSKHRDYAFSDNFSSYIKFLLSMKYQMEYYRQQGHTYYW